MIEEDNFYKNNKIEQVTKKLQIQDSLSGYKVYIIRTKAKNFIKLMVILLKNMKVSNIEHMMMVLVCQQLVLGLL